jgi:tricorn protease interacting factor F2/3
MAARTPGEKHQTLGDNVIPLSYRLFFEPNLKTFRTAGRELIACRVRKATKTIKLNSKEIVIRRASVKSGKKLQDARVRKDGKSETIELAFGEAVKGRIEISIEFACTNNDKMYGFYRSSYSVDGKRKHLLSSQFEAANARAAFPCFDEPEFKATFALSMLIDKRLESVSNMPVRSVKSVSPAKKLVEFEETPRMSSYLLYLSVGEFEFTEDRIGKLKIRIITTPGKKQFAKLPMKYARESVGWLQDYFGMAYPLPKIDYIAIPDFAAGAMENWGAITFREIALLGDERTALPIRQYIAGVVAHETVHQWFGDLVTMRWWNDTWLNESFAEFMSSKAMGQMHPEWNLERQYLENTIGVAFYADSLRTTHPISVRVEGIGDITSIFDAISYQKGGSILYMLEDYVGKDVYRDGLRRYLKKHAYSNATKRDLWDAIQQASRAAGKRIDVSDVIEKWVTKSGHPLVRLRRVPGGFSLRQGRYMLLGQAEDSWPIPIHYLSPGGVSSTLMRMKEQKLDAKGEWIKLNYGQKGFYRVKYEDGLLDEIGKLIRDNRISDIDAWGVENDLFAFARSARVSVDEYLDFVDSYCMDKGYPVNSGISAHLNWLYVMGYGHELGEKAGKASVRFHSRMLERLSWERKEGDDAITVMLRSGAIMSLGLAGDRGTLARAKKEFDAFRNEGKELDVNIRGAIYALNAWQDGRTFDWFLKRYKEEKAPDEQRRNLRALGSFGDPAMLRRTLALSNSDAVRLQDSFLLPAAVSANPAGKALVWDWTRKNWKTFLRKYDTGTQMLGGLVDNLSSVSDAKTESEIKAFFARKENRRGDMERALAHALERIRANIRFMEKNGFRR